MIGLTDHQLKIVMGAARMLPVEKLHGFIEASNYPTIVKQNRKPWRRRRHQAIADLGHKPRKKSNFNYRGKIMTPKDLAALAAAVLRSGLLAGYSKAEILAFAQKTAPSPAWVAALTEAAKDKK